ncbi:MAG: acyl carrier protein [Solirubrobacterales bacterium]
MTVPADTLPTAFPEAEVIEALKKFWADETGSSTKTGSPFGAPKKGGGTVFDVRPELDSLRAVEVLLEVEKIIGVELPDTVVKLGGYDGYDEFMDQLVPSIRAFFDKKQSKKKK